MHRSLYHLLFAIAITGVSSASHADTITDNFNDNFTDPLLWKTFQVGTGPTVAEQNGRVEISVPGTSQGAEFGAAYLSQQLISGDFDIQISYSLLAWPAQNGIRVGIGLNTIETAVEHTSFGPNDVLPAGDAYLTDFLDGVQGVTTTADLSGKLRITRTGSTLSGYFWNGQDWTLIHQGPGATGPSEISLAVWGADQFSQHQDVKVAFDDFVAVIESPKTVPDGGSSSLVELTGVLLLSVLGTGARLRSVLG